MDKRRNNKYNGKKYKKNEVIHLITAPKDLPVREIKEKVSARDIQNSIGIYGSFGRTLVDLHKRGR